MDTPIALEIAEIMSGQPIDSVEDAQSAISELMNIIVGNAVSELDFATDDIKITPPTLFYAMPLESRINEAGLTFLRQITTSRGNIEFNLNLEKMARG